MLIAKCWRTFVRRNILLTAIVFLSSALSAADKLTAEQRAAQHFESVRHEPLLLLAFLQQMPKGGDLHNHLTGAIYAESFICYAAESGLCVDARTNTFVAPPCDPAGGRPPVTTAFSNPQLYRELIDAFSVRDFHPHCTSAGDNQEVCESTHDHFFDAFGKFGASTEGRLGDMLAEVSSRGAEDHESYIETMYTLDGKEAANLGKAAGWDDDFAALRDKLIKAGIGNAVAAARKNLDAADARRKSLQHCGEASADPGCAVDVRFLYQILRGLPKEVVFAQLLTGFELAQADRRVVGLNMVMPEDAYVPMHDFDLHMRMVGYLHTQYPKVHITLHAGELAPGLVPPEGLRFHIRESVEVAHAERIGHGVDVMHETDPVGLLKEMAQKNVLVEICLTSNDAILGIVGKEHPLPIYMKYGVPVALATDDLGVSRSDMTHEYLRAAQTYDLKYEDLKRFARASLEHSFLPGESLWSDAAGFRRNAACEGEETGAKTVASRCQQFLEKNERARAQWKLEGEFARFEAQY